MAFLCHAKKSGVSHRRRKSAFAIWYNNFKKKLLCNFRAPLDAGVFENIVSQTNFLLAGSYGAVRRKAALRLGLWYNIFNKTT